MTCRVVLAVLLLAASPARAETPPQPAAPAQAAAAPAPKSWRAGVEAFAKAHFIHPAWGWQHSLRDYDTAKALAKADGVALDDDVLYAAAMLHDIAAFVPWADPDPAKDHSDVGAKALVKVLKDEGFPEAKIAAVQEATRTHMYYRRGQTAEAAYLHDADGLDWLGAIGAARLLATVEHADPLPAKPDPNAIPDLQHALMAIQHNLIEVPDTLQTPAARARAAALVSEGHALIAAIRAESANGLEL